MPEAVVTRPESERPEAVVWRNSSPHPPATIPEMTFGSNVPLSSRAYRLHTPFGLLNMNALSIVGTPLEFGSMYGGGGAGGAKADCGASQLTGLKLPVTSGPLFGIGVIEKSEKVSVAIVVNGVVPPASAMNMYLTPVGPTSRKSILSGSWCVTS